MRQEQGKEMQVGCQTHILDFVTPRKLYKLTDPLLWPGMMPAVLLDIDRPASCLLPAEQAVKHD